jgi:uncharacterized membrane protein
MNDLARAPSRRKRPAGVRLLLAANGILIAVTWIISGYEYGRLPRRVVSWLSLWRAGLPRVERSAAFFIYPVSQAVFLAAFLVLAEVYFVRAPENGNGPAPGDAEKGRRLRNFKEEVVLLAAVFFNLIFIHLQTSLILLSRGAGAGINRYYALTLVAVLVILVPYYYVRRETILKGRG